MGNSIPPVRDASRTRINASDSNLFWRFIYAIGIMIAVVLIVRPLFSSDEVKGFFASRDVPRQSIVATSSAPVLEPASFGEKVLRVHVPPRGKSVAIPIHFGTHIDFESGNFVLHNVYADGTECVQTGETECHRGNAKQNYLENLGDQPLNIEYRYVEG